MYGLALYTKSNIEKWNKIFTHTMRTNKNKKIMQTNFQIGDKVRILVEHSGCHFPDNIGWITKIGKIIEVQNSKDSMAGDLPYLAIDHFFPNELEKFN